jgi:hypothetical protein
MRAVHERSKTDIRCIFSLLERKRYNSANLSFAASSLMRTRQPYLTRTGLVCRLQPEEYYMRYSILAGTALSLGLLISSSAAFAADPTSSDCRQMDSQVRTALETNQSANHDEAVRERNSALLFCSRGYYKLGAAHFAQALKLLGSEKG